MIGRLIANPWVIGGLGVLLLAIVAGAYIKGRHDARELCEGQKAAMRLEAQQKLTEELARQARVQNQNLEAAQRRADQAAGMVADLQKQVDDYEAELATRTDAAACILSPRDADSLQ